MLYFFKFIYLNISSINKTYSVILILGLGNSKYENLKMVNLWLYTMSILKIAWHYIALCFPSYMIYITAHNQNILRFSLNPTSLKIEIEISNKWQNVGNH